MIGNWGRTIESLSPSIGMWEAAAATNVGRCSSGTPDAAWHGGATARRANRSRHCSSGSAKQSFVRPAEPVRAKASPRPVSFQSWPAMIARKQDKRNLWQFEP